MNNNKPKTGTVNSPSMLVPLTPTENQIRNFKKKIRFDGDGGCWEWLASKNKGGYGYSFSKMANGKSRSVKAHRLAHVVFEGVQPLDQVVRHQCRNPSCVRPSHSKLGTMLDNFNDAVRDGTCGRGEDHRDSKLNWNSVNEIRRAYADKEMNQRQLGDKFGVDQSNIYFIIYNITWVDEHYQPPQKVNTSLANAEIKQIRKLRSEGETLRQIAEKTGRSLPTVRKYLNQ